MRIVRNDAEARVGRIFLHDPAQRHLRGRCHRIGLVKDDELIGRHRVGGRLRGRREDLARACKCLDLLTDYVNATVIGGIKLEDHLPHILRAVDAACKREDR